MGIIGTKIKAGSESSGVSLDGGTVKRRAGDDNKTADCLMLWFTVHHLGFTGLIMGMHTPSLVSIKHTLKVELLQATQRN